MRYGWREFGPIGLDWGGRSIKAVQLARAQAGWRAHAVAALPLPEPNAAPETATIRRLQDVLHRRGFSGNRVVLAAPTPKLEVDLFDLPPRSSGAPLEQFARAELARSAKMEPDNFEMACWDLPPTARATATTSVMAVGLRHADGEALVDTFDEEGLEVCGIDTRALALVRACSPPLADEDVSAVLDLGWNGAFLVLTCSGVVIYQRLLADTGTSILHRQLTSRFQLSAELAEEMMQATDVSAHAAADGPGAPTAVQELVVRHVDVVLSELDVSLAYARHRYPDRRLRRILLVGGGACLSGLAEHVNERLNLETTVVPPAQLVTFPPKLEPYVSSAHVAAVGLARYEEESS